MDTFRRAIRKLIGEFKRVPDTKQARLDFLVRWSNVQCRSWTAASDRRKKFQRTRKFDRLMKKTTACWVCALPGKLVRHHMIQIQHGGENWKQNVVVICEWCHAEIHGWLEVPDHPVVVEAKAMDVVRR